MILMPTSSVNIAITPRHMFKRVSTYKVAARVNSRTFEYITDSEDDLEEIMADLSEDIADELWKSVS